MNAPDSQVLSRISKLLLAGIGVAFAWLLLAFALGISSSDAHADDDSGLIDGLGSTLAGATSGVTDTVGSVAQSVAPAIQHVVSTPPAQPVRSIVGDAPAAFGMDDALATVDLTVHALTQTTTDAADAVTGVLDAATSYVPGIPPFDIADDVFAPRAGAADVDAAPQPLATLARAAMLSGATAWASLTTSDPAGAASDLSATAAPGLSAIALLRAALQADSVISGPGGAGLGVWALVALGPVVAYRAWMRRSGLENDVTPAAPTFSTDVSPD